VAGDLDGGGHGLGAAACDFKLGAGDLLGVGVSLKKRKSRMN
jgi:hypothetical protein